METRLFRETRSVLEYLHQHPPTLSRGVLKLQADDRSISQFSKDRNSVGWRLRFRYMKIGTSRDVRAGEPGLVLHRCDGIGLISHRTCRI